MKGAREALGGCTDIETGEVSKFGKGTTGVASIRVQPGSALTRQDIVRLFALKRAYVTSIHPQDATVGAMLSGVHRELELGRDRGERSGKLLRHPRVGATLQCLAKLNLLARVLRSKNAPVRIAGDAEATTLLQLVDTHIALLEQRGLVLPNATTGQIVERRTWQGPEIAAATWLSRADLLPFYRRTLAAVQKRAAAAAAGADDKEIAAQYGALADWAKSALEALRIRTVKS